MPADALATLQRLVLEAALTDRDLPGYGGHARLPDLDLLRSWSGGPLRLDASSVINPAVVTGLQPLVLIVTADDLGLEAQEFGRLPYLHLRTESQPPDDVRITLHAAIREGGGQTVELGGVSIAFRRTRNRWEVSGEPRLFSS
ncbi:hypothetical protein [Kribbella speibonae]|uniref:Uncharacterized protein n=1 Tax=Kribbella speibonae TaxID=1572660 RepID=A0A4R0IKB4_9ACTN|nr:hypothetical protein [Kribbella speibonae]TCC33199.1 hypothetical protein E0H92_34205 [Kribbella speibonae]